MIDTRLIDFKNSITPIVKELNRQYNKGHVVECGVLWNKIYDKYDEVYNCHEEEDWKVAVMKVYMEEIAKVPNEVVFGTTDYLKQKYYFDEGLI